MKTYNHRQFGECEVIAEYADTMVVKTQKGCFLKITPMGIVPVTQEFVNTVTSHTDEP